METTAIEMPEGWADEEDPTVRGAWAIQDRGSLDWAMSRLAALMNEGAEIEAQADAAKARIEKRAAELLQKIERGMAFFEAKIAEYAQANRSLLLGGGKKKSATLLHGTVGWRAGGGRLRVKEGGKPDLLAWLERQPLGCGLYRVVIEPDMAAIQKHHEATGEIPPGMEFVPAGETFYVKPIAPEGALARKP